MRLRLLLFTAILCLCFKASALHLAGGDMELRHLHGYQYRLTLNLFFDEINALPEYRDQNITVTIFEKGTNRLMMTVTMPLREQKLIEYAQVDCQSDELKISKILYFQDIYLNPTVYNHPQGYYAVWERCCRNRSISNITMPEEAGQAFYMEFPAVVKDGSFFKNSSPLLPQPLSDYACVNEPFTYDLSSTDADGDVLVYDLVTPFNGNGTIDVTTPTASPGPYPEISWLPGYSKNNAVPGSPGLSIDSKTGRLTVKPTQKGFFTFAIRCQEFRNGVKIGEVRRDMQLMVKECTLNRPPTITAMERGSSVAYKPGQVLDIRQSGPRCIDVFFTDPDRNETLTLKAQPVNFNGNYFQLTGQTSGQINRGLANDVLKASLCFEDCMDTEGKVFLLDVIVGDHGDSGCGLPKQDTIRISFKAEAIPDRPPSISFSEKVKVLEPYEGETLQIEVTGRDPDEDSVTVTARGIGFDLSTYNISFEPKSGQGQTSTFFNWPIDCKAMDRHVYQVEFKVTTIRCNRPYARTEILEIRPRYKAIQNNTITGEQRVCYGVLPSIISGSVPTGGNGSYTYTWEVSTTNAIQGFKAAPGDNKRQSYSPGALIQTSWFRRRVTAGACNQQVSEAVLVTIDPQAIVRHVPSADICPGETATLQAEAYTSDTELEWYSQPTGGSPFFLGTAYTTPPLQTTTEYYVQAKSSRGCVSVAREKVLVRVQPPKADAGEDMTIIAGGSAGLRAKGGISYQWSPAESLSDPNSANPTARPDKTTTYTVTVTTQYGCTDTDEVMVEVIPRIKPTNAVTLNGDGLNDTWYIENIEYYPSCHIQIFTRWGAKIFESTGYSIPWDGTHQGQQLPMAAYYYIIKLDDKEKPTTGSITLIK